MSVHVAHPGRADSCREGLLIGVKQTHRSIDGNDAIDPNRTFGGGSRGTKNYSIPMMESSEEKLDIANRVDSALTGASLFSDKRVRPEIRVGRNFAP
jgi:hypothetical protein